MNPREAYLRTLYTVSKNTHPDVWIKFVEALSAYTQDQMERVITSVPTNEALLAIGMVRHMREFRDEVKNIDDAIRKMDKEKNKGTLP
jgi:hypothetical protein